MGPCWCPVLNSSLHNVHCTALTLHHRSIESWKGRQHFVNGVSQCDCTDRGVDIITDHLSVLADAP